MDALAKIAGLFQMGTILLKQLADGKEVDVAQIDAAHDALSKAISGMTAALVAGDESARHILKGEIP